MAVRASREVVFDATPEAILDVLADIETLPAWTSVYRHAEALDRHPDGRPLHVKATMRLMGITEQGSARIQLGPALGGVGRQRHL